VKLLSAHGKVILFGEHAVVYGRPALAMGLDDAMRFISVSKHSQGLTLNVQPWDLHASCNDESLLGQVLHRVQGWFPAVSRCILTFHSSIPLGAGLGSSAALSVLLLRVLSALTGEVMAPNETRERAHKLETVFHGTPSGLDDTLAVFGGLAWFQRHGFPTENHAFSVLTPQLRALPFPKPSLVIGESGRPRATKALVAGLNERYGSNKDEVEMVFNEIEKCFHQGLKALECQDNSSFGAALTDNHQALASLGLSCSELDRMVELALSKGALGAKLTGAGGGGCAVAFAPGHEDEIVSIWNQNGFNAWIVPSEPIKETLE